MAYYPHEPETSAHYKLYSPESGITAVFNNPSDPNYVGMVAEITGLDSPEVREQAEDLVMSDGGNHGAFYHGRRPITLNGRIFGHATMAERRLRSDRVRRASLAMRRDAILSWAPATRSENITPNPRMGDGLNNWTTSTTAGSTTTRTAIGSGAGAPSGTATAIEHTFTAAATGHNSQMVPAAPYSYVDDSGAGATINPADVASLTAAQWVHVSAAVRIMSISAGGSPNVVLRVRCFNAANTNLGDVAIGTLTAQTVAANWVTYSGAIPVSSLIAGTVRVALMVNVQSVAAQTIVWRTTNASLSLRWDSALQPYMDGAQAGGYWWGAPDKSPSGDYLPMQVNVRRQQPYRETGAWNKDFQLQMVSASALILNPVPKHVALTHTANSVTLENNGNATYFPRNAVLVGAFNNDMHFLSSGNGGDFMLSMGQATVGVTYFIDFLLHTFTDATFQAMGGFVDWAVTTKWPGHAPGTNVWSETGSVAYTSWTMDFDVRDAWI